ncbi:GNAT family N-acetyltransferase [Streptomyces albus subsp. chlorinus]|nr:GNAT family N-acetyltransferase [Streptomyces albus subsp. chlorinus]
MDVGSARIVGRHVLLRADEEAVREATAGVTVPETWIMVFAEPDEVAAWLPHGWQVDHGETGHLMTADLTLAGPGTGHGRAVGGPDALPDGYARTVETRDGVTLVRIDDAAGEPAARGQMAVRDGAAVMDRISTEEAHRRRGLGSVVMRTLADRAVAAGATLGLLGATPQGRALYETLGWRVRSVLTECVYRP